MLRSCLLSASAVAAVSLGALLYTVTGHGERTVEVAPASASAERPEHLIALYREQMKLTQERLRALGYVPGPIDGIMGSGTAGALRAFQEQQGLRVTGRANPETLAALGIEDRRAGQNCSWGRGRGAVGVGRREHRRTHPECAGGVRRQLAIVAARVIAAVHQAVVSFLKDDLQAARCTTECLWLGHTQGPSRRRRSGI